MTERRTVLFLSPHLDDVAFSCGGLAALLADAGWHTVLATVFTKSVISPKGFALACQLDKGLGPDADYMEIRRTEDEHAAGILGVGTLHWMDFAEAPHRGYTSPAALFGAIRTDDRVAEEIILALRALDASHRPDIVLAPQALGRHVDHQIVAACAQSEFGTARLACYRDTPYAIRDWYAEPWNGAEYGSKTEINITNFLMRKISASAAYATQIGFQFGDVEALEKALRSFAWQEGAGAMAAEKFLGCVVPA